MDKYKVYGEWYNDQFRKVSTVQSDWNFMDWRMGYVGNWGWIDKEGNEIVPCQYLLASQLGEEIIVCKGKIKTKEDDEDQMIGCELHAYGVVDIYGNEIVPCEFYDLVKIKRVGTDRNCYFCWMLNGRGPEYEWEHVCIYDADNKRMLKDADIGHDWNESVSVEVMNDEYAYIYEFVYDDKDYDAYISIYSFADDRWECQNEFSIIENGMFKLNDGRQFPYMH